MIKKKKNPQNGNRRKLPQSLLTMVHIAKAMVFPVIMYRCDRWTIKKAKHQRNDAFELWCWKESLVLGEAH